MIDGIFLATPCYGGLITERYLASVLALQPAAAAAGLALEIQTLGDDALITRVRNRLVRRFLDGALSHLLFVDADIGFRPEAVLRLKAFAADVVGGIYPVKRVDPAALAGHADCPARAYDYVVGWGDADAVDGRDGFARARWLGAGFLMIARPVLEALGAGWFDTAIDDGVYLSEDYAFCRRAAAAGFGVWADLMSRLSHTGPFTLSGDPAGAGAGLQERP